jgi:tetratricopeptide (TPR) repeat protein
MLHDSVAHARALFLAAALAAAAGVACQTVTRTDQRLTRAETLTRAGQWDEAATLWGNIYRDSLGANRRAGWESARANHEAGRPGVALTRLAELNGLWPGDADILELLGKAHEAAGDPEAAREAYAAVLEVEPGRPHALARIGVLGEASSIAQLRAAGAIRSVDAASLFDLGMQAATAGLMEDAFIAFDAAVESGDISLRQEVEAAAAIAPDRRTIPWMQSVIRADPLHTRALTLLGNAQLAAGLTGAALETLRQAASSDPSDEAAMRAFAAALTQSGQNGRALEILDRLDARGVSRIEGFE